MAVNYYCVNKGLFWTIFPLFVGAAFSLGFYFANNKFDADKNRLHSENKALIASLDSLKKAIHEDYLQAQTEAELDFFLRKYMEKAKPTLMDYRTFIELFIESIADQNYTITGPKCISFNENEFIIRYHVKGGPRNMDVYADWLVSSKKDFVTAKSEFAKAMETTVVALRR